MEQRWKNLAIVIVFLILLVVVLSVFNSAPEPVSTQKTFLQKYSDLSNVWKSEGLNEQFFHSDFGKVSKLSPASLAKLKNSFQTYNSETSDASFPTLLTLYSKLVEYAQLNKETSTEALLLSNSQEPLCSLVQRYSQLNSKMHSSSGKLAEISIMVDNFIRQYPTSASEIELYTISPDLKITQESLAMQNEVILGLRSECL